MADKFDKVKEAWSRFKDCQNVCLATMKGNKPRVRPVTLIYFNKRFWIATGTTSAKVKQIQRNPKVEFCLLFKEDDRNCCIRVAGLAKIIRNKETKAKIAKHFDSFSKHWESVDDPNYTLLKIHPTEIKYVRPDKTTRMKI